MRIKIIILIISISLSSCLNNSPTPRLTAPSEATTTPSASPALTQGNTNSVQVVSPAPTKTQLPNIPTASATPPPSHSTVCSPLASHTLAQLAEIVSSPYEPPPPGKDERHHGADFFYYNHAGRPSIEGEGVQSILVGHVAASIHDRLPYGNMVIIETPHELLPDEIVSVIDIPAGASIYHLYAHFEATPLVELGQQIECGQLLGSVGKTGYVVPVAHLHLETRIGPPGERFESIIFFDTQATPEEQAAYVRWRTSGEFQHFDPMDIFVVSSE